MEVRLLDSLIYSEELDPEKLDSWLKRLEVNFSTTNYTKTQSTNFARLSLEGHALTWGEAYVVDFTFNKVPSIQT